MDEDIVQNNRNAFNEDYDCTLQNYINIWKKIENGIGPSWFFKPFGSFMKSYFTQTITDKLDTVSLYNLSDLFIPYPIPIHSDVIQINKKRIFTILDGNDIIKKMFIISDHLFTRFDIYSKKYMDLYLNMKDIFWRITEDEWKNDPTIRDTLHSIADDILDEIEDDKIDQLYRADIKRIVKDALNEIEYHTVDEVPELHLVDIKEAVQEIINKIEHRDLIPEIKNTLHTVMHEIEKRE